MRGRIAEVHGSHQNGENKDKLPSIDTIKEMSVEKRAKKKQMVEKQSATLKEIIERLTKDLYSRKKEQKACEDWIEQVSKMASEEAGGETNKAA